MSGKKTNTTIKINNTLGWCSVNFKTVSISTDDTITSSDNVLYTAINILSSNVNIDVNNILIYLPNTTVTDGKFVALNMNISTSISNSAVIINSKQISLGIKSLNSSATSAYTSPLSTSCYMSTIIVNSSFDIPICINSSLISLLTDDITPNTSFPHEIYTIITLTSLVKINSDSIFMSFTDNLNITFNYNNIITPSATPSLNSTSINSSVICIYNSKTSINFDSLFLDSRRVDNLNILNVVQLSGSQTYIIGNSLIHTLSRNSSGLSSVNAISGNNYISVNYVYISIQLSIISSSGNMLYINGNNKLSINYLYFEIRSSNDYTYYTIYSSGTNYNLIDINEFIVSYAANSTNKSNAYLDGYNNVLINYYSSSGPCNGFYISGYSDIKINYLVNSNITTNIIFNISSTNIMSNIYINYLNHVRSTIYSVSGGYANLNINYCNISISNGGSTHFDVPSLTSKVKINIYSLYLVISNTVNAGTMFNMYPSDTTAASVIYINIDEVNISCLNIAFVLLRYNTLFLNIKYMNATVAITTTNSLILTNNSTFFFILHFCNFTGNNKHIILYL